MCLRITGAVIGGAVSLLAIIIVSPNFDTLPAYMLAVFAVFCASTYSSLGSARMTYAGKQMGIVFALVFVGLSPSINIYEPLWRIGAPCSVILPWRLSSSSYGLSTVIPCCPDAKSHWRYARASAERLSFEQRGSNPEDELRNDAHADRDPPGRR